MKIKNFLKIKVSFALSTILIFIFFFLIIFLFINIQIQIDDLMVYASGIDLIKDIKNSQYIAIVKGEPLKFEIENNKFKISYTKENLIYLDNHPLFKSVNIEPDGMRLLIKDDGTFEFLTNKNEINLRKENKIIELFLKKSFSYKIKLENDGKIFIEKH